MAELAKLLGFMSAWDRRATLQKYEALFDQATDHEELIATIGTPTKLAISLALNYVPSPAPASIPTESAEETADAPVEDENGEVGEAPSADEEESGELSSAQEEEASAEEESEEETLPPVSPRPRRKVRFFGLLFSIIFGLVIGVPLAIVLICLGLPFVVTGLGLGAGVVWAAVSAIPMLALFSDILVVLGVGLVLVALALLLLWFGLWVSFELGYLWISGVVLRLGRALTYKKEVAANE